MDGYCHGNQEIASPSSAALFSSSSYCSCLLPPSLPLSSTLFCFLLFFLSWLLIAYSVYVLHTPLLTPDCYSLCVFYRFTWKASFKSKDNGCLVSQYSVCDAFSCCTMLNGSININRDPHWAYVSWTAHSFTHSLTRSLNLSNCCWFPTDMTA